MNRTLYLLLTIFAVALWACDDTVDDSSARERGTLTILLSSGDLSVATRVDADVDREFYIDAVQLFFYTDKSAGAVLTKRVVVDGYRNKSITLALSDSELSSLFASSDLCYLYVVANGPDTGIADNATVADLKSILLSTDFASDKFDADQWSIPMDGDTDELKLDRSSMTVSGSVTLKRAIAKIQLNISLANSVTDNGKTYVPQGAIKAYLYNGARAGALNDVIESSERNYTSNDYIVTYATTGTTTQDGYIDYSHTPFYSYHNLWSSNLSDNETSIILIVPWAEKSDGELDYIPYYYQLPVNDETYSLIRNNFYKIHLTVAMLGSTTEEEPRLSNSATYEIENWNDADTDFTENLNTGHYLVVDDNTFTLLNASDLSLSYSACAEMAGVYLKSVSYKSTTYKDASGEYETIYLYDTQINSTSGAYEKIDNTSYSANSQTVRSKYSEIVSAIEKGSIVSVTDTPDRNDKEIYEGTGTIKFHADVEEIASKLYVPVKYTLVIVGSHNTLHTFVYITQYPSKYIEYGKSGNVFVNGYYTRVAYDDGYTSGLTGAEKNDKETDGTYYKSYPFIYASYDSSNSRYYSSSKLSENIFNKSSSSGYSSTWCNTSYLVLPYKPNTITFPNTIDVHVSAFTSTDNTFNVTVDGSRKSMTYVLGNPRVKGSFKKDTTHDTSKYIDSGDELYDYLTGCKDTTIVTQTTGAGPKNGPNSENGQTTSYRYYRNVASWGNNAANVYVGGTDTGFDNVIAPLFKIQSTYGIANFAANFNVAQKRCATYQEAGYPAGRWRLPTLAEIAFVVKLQNEGVLDAMFSSSSAGYWTSSAGCIVANTDMKYTANYKDKTDLSSDYLGYNWTSGESDAPVCFVRCVYDLWYWGESPTTPTHEFHIKPTL